MSGKYFLKTALVLASENSFSQVAEKHFSVQKKTYCFLLGTFLPASENHYLTYTEAYLKLLSLLLATIFLYILNKSFIGVSGNGFSV